MIDPRFERSLVTQLRIPNPRQDKNTTADVSREDGRRYLLTNRHTDETLGTNMRPRELIKLVWTVGGRDYHLKPRIDAVLNGANRTIGGSYPAADLRSSEWDLYFKNGRHPIDKKRQLERQDQATTGQLPSEVVTRRTTGERVKMRRFELGLSQEKLGQLAGLTQPTISALEKNRAHTSGSLASIAQALQVNAFWLETGLGEMELSIAQVPSDLDTVVVPFLPSEGNCGSTCLGAKLDYSPICIRTDLLSKCHVTPVGQLIATYGEGDSMSNFIMTGDILVFDTGARAISDGNVYLIDTPDGPRMKRINRRADGRVVLRNNNQDKGRYPDEEYTAEQAQSLSIKGKLVLRIAGS